MAATAFAYPVNAELDTIEQVTLPQLQIEQNNPFLENFPDEPHESDVIMWEQEDNYTGLMGFRGYGNKPNLVGRVGFQRFLARPGVFGDMIPLYEEELTRRRRMGFFTGRMSIDDMIAQAQTRLLVRRLQLKAKMVADFVTTGAYSVADSTGVSYTGDSYTPQTSASSVPWSNLTTSTPFADIQAAVQVPFGQSIDWSQSELIINQLKVNQLLLNRNAADFWGLRNPTGGTVGNSLNDINTVMGAAGLPRIRGFDGFYLADNSTRRGLAVRLAPTAIGVLFARRSDGSRPGGFALTWNINAANGGPSAYNKVFYRGEIEVPASVEVHHGFNGGPIIRYPGTIVLLTGI